MHSGRRDEGGGMEMDRMQSEKAQRPTTSLMLDDSARGALWSGNGGGGAIIPD